MHECQFSVCELHVHSLHTPLWLYQHDSFLIHAERHAPHQLLLRYNINVVLSRSSSLLSSALSRPSLAVRKVFQDSSALTYTHTGYNAMYGSRHAKGYHHEDGICASVVRHVRVFGSRLDPDIGVYD